MKKGLLLSVVASTVIFAGGDIAPVEPAAPAPVADCNDFYGSVGAYYEAKAEKAGDLFATDVATNSNKFDVTATIGVEKTIVGGLSVGAEASGWANVGLYDTNDTAPIGNRLGSGSLDSGQLSQLYLAYSIGNTALKVGKFALPGSLSPLMHTGSTAGVKDTTYEGGLIANTDISDTTLYGVYVYSHMSYGVLTNVGVDATGSVGGAFAFGFQNKSLENTTITGVGYYSADFFANGSNPTSAATAFALNVSTKLGGFDIDAQTTYVTGAQTVATVDDDAASTAGLKLAYDFGTWKAWGAVSYSSAITGNGATLAGGTGALIGDSIDQGFGQEGTAIGGGVKVPFWIGTIYAAGSYINNTVTAPDTGTDTATNVKAGYLFKVAGVNMKAEYRVSSTQGVDVDGATPDAQDSNRVRLEATYKF